MTKKRYIHFGLLVCGGGILLFGLFSPMFILKSCMGSSSPEWSKWGTIAEVRKENRDFSLQKCKAIEAEYTKNNFSFDPLPPIRVYPSEVLILGGGILLYGAIKFFIRRKVIK